MNAQLTIAQHAGAEGPVFTLAGELDLTTVPVLRNLLMAAVETVEQGHITIDMCAVEFMDSAGLAVLVIATKRLVKRDAEWLEVVAVGQPLRVLRVGQLNQIMTISEGKQTPEGHIDG